MIEYIEIKNIASVTMGQSPKGETYNEIGNGLLLLNGPTDVGETHPTTTLSTTDSKRECKEGDLIFCVRGSTTGRMNWADQKDSLGRGVGAIGGKNYLQTKNLKHCLTLVLPALLNLAGGSTFPNLNKDDIRKFKIPKIDNPEHIASILSSYDDLIENNNKRIFLLEQMAEQIYKRSEER